MKNFLTMAALALVGAIIAGCSGSDDIIDDAPQPATQKDNIVTMKTTVGLESGGETRALDPLTREKTFAAGETMALVYANQSNKRTVKESEPLGAGDIAADGKSATFTFNLTEEPNKNTRVKYIYPAAMAMADGNENYEALFTEQDGTLTKLASNFDVATTDNLAWVNGNLPGATLENQLAILAITLKDNATGADITGSITGLTLTASDLSHGHSTTYNITRSAAPGPIYVAIIPTNNLYFEVTATDGAYTYTKTLEGKTYEINNGYNVSWRMTNMNSVPLTMEALSAGTIVVNNPREGMKYSKNGGDKTTMSGNTTITVSAGDKVQFYGTGTSITCYDGTSIAGTAYVKVYGNIMSLVNEDGFATATTLTVAYTFASLFKGNTNLTDASFLLLPATTLAEVCYYSMFESCTSLTAAPALPATTLASDCYNCMFQGCASLTDAPALPATTLKTDCYQSMFYGCSSLKRAPALPATALADQCYQSMFYGCTSLETAPALPATTLAYYCYRSMFRDCISLKTAPALPAPTLPEGCYYTMFSGCTKLKAVTCLATNISALWCTTQWLNNAGTQVTGTKTFTKAASMEDWTTGVSGIPDGWTVVDAPSE